jgi:hypothetical protein
MKKIMFFTFCLFNVFVACKEQTPSGLILTQTISKDTTYISSIIEAPQLKNVFIEELTGAKCVNCPEGTVILRNLVAQHQGRVFLSAIHSGFLTSPPTNAKYDFRNADADALRSFFNEGDPSKPSASFDRVLATSGGSVGKAFIEKGATGGDWLSVLPARLAKPTPVNIHLSSSYDATANQVNIKVKLAFTEDLNEKLALSLFVLENGRRDEQEGKDPNTGSPKVIEDYEFEHVLKKLITPAAGDLILDSVLKKEKGRIVERVISFKPDVFNAASNINGLILDSCVIVGAVHKTGTSKEIIHVEEIKLK